MRKRKVDLFIPVVIERIQELVQQHIEVDSRIHLLGKVEKALKGLIKLQGDNTDENEHPTSGKR